MESQDLLFSKANGVGLITLNRPKRLNAVTPAMVYDLAKWARELPREHPDVKVLVITGAGSAFCTGTDLEGLNSRLLGDQPSRPPIRLPHPEGSWQLAFAQCERPIIGAINGYAVGLGLGLALACDFRIASQEAKFLVAQTRRGRRPDGGLSFLLPRVVGVAKALELMFTGDIIDAEEALRIGAVSKVVPAEELMPTVLELAERIAQGPNVAQTLAKRMVYKTMYAEEAVIAAGEMEYYTGLVCDQTEDAREGLLSFREKRLPVFKGR